ncbi:amino acid adenylation domain-containing protein [Streptomyces sp. NPDC054863]
MAERIRCTPDATALRLQAGSLTYRELGDDVARIATDLAGRGVRPGDVVALWAPRGAPAVLALLGILAAGAAYLPLDPAEPAARVGDLCADSGVRLAVADTAVGPPEMPGNVTVVSLAELATSPATPWRPQGPVSPEAPAYVMCTSGTTGRPKAVSVPHGGVVRLVRDQWYARFGPDTRMLLHSPLSFDASVFEIFAPLLNGGELVIAPPGRLSPADLGGVLHRHAVNTLYLTASLLRLVVDEEPTALDGLRLLFTGGEVASAEHLERLRRKLPNRRLVNLYGPTENTVSSTMYPVPPHTPVTSPVPIGRPVDGAEVHVVGEDGRPVPDGVTGELWLGGAGLAHGYLGAAGPAAARFVPHIDGVPGHRLYRSGDLGHRRADGNLVFEGRIDDQLKIEGHRIEPGEIEHMLRRHPAVSDAFVHAQHVPSAERRLVAHLVPRATGLDPRVVREFLCRRLPAYLVPHQYVVVDRLPLKENGKVDRDRLPLPEEASARSPATAPRPLSPTERRVAAIWCEVLRVDAVGPEDDFFAKGGTSIGASRVVARIRTGLGVELPLAVIFDTPSLAEVARAVDAVEAASAAPTPRTAPAAPRPESGFTVALSAQQRARLAANRAAGDGRTQPVVLVHHLRGRLDVSALRSALHALVARHDVLATRYPDGSEPVGEVAAAGGRRWPLEVRARPQLRSGDAAALREQHDFGRRPFDLATGPVVRALLTTNGDREHLLGLAVDHISFDELSADLLLGELSALYREAAGGAPAGLGPVTQYQTYALLTAERHSGSSGRAAVGRAVDELRTGGFRPPLPLPAHQGYDARAAGPTRTVERDLPAVPADRLAGGITPGCIHLSAVAAAVSRFAAKEQFGFQVSQSGRHLPGTDTTVGCLTELAFVHFERADCADFTRLCEGTRRQLVRLATDPPPFAAALARLRADGHGGEVERLRHRPYLLFHHRQETHVPLFAPGLDLIPLRPPASRKGLRRDPALSVTTHSGPGGGRIAVEYAEAGYPPEFAAALADAAADALSRFVARAGAL